MNLPVIHLDREGGGGTGTGWDGQVEFRADLPITLVTPLIGSIFLVEKPTTILFGAYTTYQSGLYLKEADTGSLNDWRRLNIKLKFTDGQFAIVSSADESKQAKFDLSLITTGTTRTLTIQDADGVLAFKTGIQAFFLEARGSFGTGGGWADSGFIDDLPVLLFAPNSTEKAIYMHFAMGRFKFDEINPELDFIIYSTTAPGIGDEDVEWLLEARYIAENESPSKAADETLSVTQTLPNQTLNTRQSVLVFTLDRTKITSLDTLMFKLSRVGGDVLDNYTGDIAVSQSGIILQTLDVNP